MSKQPSNAPKPTFAKGDQVVLKSGGPVMTVEKPISSTTTGFFNGNYRCQWFAGKKLDSGNFPEESLEKAPPKP